MKVGYTGGTFDLFHVGHLRLLENAKKLCDVLIVGVSTDGVVSSYKNGPVISLEQRMEIVSGLSCVDMVVPQDTLDKYRMWEKLKFDVLFIGDDWYGSDSWKEYEEKLGIPVVYIPHTQGISTSIIKEQIHEVW